MDPMLDLKEQADPAAASVGSLSVGDPVLVTMQGEWAHVVGRGYVMAASLSSLPQLVDKSSLKFGNKTIYLIKRGLDLAFFVVLLQSITAYKYSSNSKHAYRPIPLILLFCNFTTFYCNTPISSSNITMND